MGLDQRVILTREAPGAANPEFAWVTTPPADNEGYALFTITGSLSFGPWQEYGGLFNSALAYTEQDTGTRFRAQFDGMPGRFEDLFYALAGAIPTVGNPQPVIPDGWPVLIEYSTGETYPDFDNRVEGFIRATNVADRSSLTGAVMDHDQAVYFSVQSADGSYLSVGFPFPETMSITMFGAPAITNTTVWASILDQGAGSTSVILNASPDGGNETALIPVAYRSFRIRYQPGLEFGSRVTDAEGSWSVTRVDSLGGRKAYQEIVCERAVV